MISLQGETKDYLIFYFKHSNIVAAKGKKETKNYEKRIMKS